MHQFYYWFKVSHRLLSWNSTRITLKMKTKLWNCIISFASPEHRFDGASLQIYNRLDFEITIGGFNTFLKIFFFSKYGTKKQENIGWRKSIGMWYTKKYRAASMQRFGLFWSEFCISLINIAYDMYFIYPCFCSIVCISVY